MSEVDVTALAGRVEELSTRLENVLTENETLRTTNTDLTTKYREIALRTIPADKRAEVEAELKELEAKSDLTDQEKQLDARARDLKADMLVFEYKDFGITKAALLKAETPEAMEVLALRAKSEALEAKSKDGAADGGKADPDPTKLASDKGAGGESGGGALKGIEGKGRDAVATHIDALMKERHGAKTGV